MRGNFYKFSLILLCIVAVQPALAKCVAKEMDESPTNIGQYLEKYNNSFLKCGGKDDPDHTCSRGTVVAGKDDKLYKCTGNNKWVKLDQNNIPDCGNNLAAIATKYDGDFQSIKGDIDSDNPTGYVYFWDGDGKGGFEAMSDYCKYPADKYKEQLDTCGDPNKFLTVTDENGNYILCSAGTIDSDETGDSEEEAASTNESTKDTNNGDNNSVVDAVQNAIDTTKIEEAKEKLEAAKEKLANAQEKLSDTKEKEQSLANRTLTAASTAATGIGMMEAASARAEQRADEAAERDMRAYLETLHCSYANKQVKYSPEEIVMPGGNELLGYYTEYKALAEKLKKVKAALKLAPGIESQVLYDRAESGLYQNTSIGKTGGAYTSLARALSDPESADAAAWAEQKDTTKKKLVGGAIAAGAGIIGGAIGNIAINGKDDASGTDWGTDSDDDEDGECDSNGVCMGEASAGDDDKEDNPTRREQKKKCKEAGNTWRKGECLTAAQVAAAEAAEKSEKDAKAKMKECRDSGGIWRANDSCECDPSKGLTAGKDQLVCECATEGEVYTKAGGKCAPRTIDLIKQGIQNARDNRETRRNQQQCEKSGGDWGTKGCTCDSEQKNLLLNATGTECMCEPGHIWNEESKGCVSNETVNKLLNIGLKSIVK